MTEEELEMYSPRIEKLKLQGRTEKAQIMRDILMGMPPKSIILLREAQAVAWDKHEDGLYSKAMLDKTRKSMYQYYGLLYKFQKGTKHELQLTDLGRDFLSWAHSNPAWGSDTKVPVQPKEMAHLSTSASEDEIVEPLVLDDEPADEFGLIWARVPAGVDIVWVEVMGEGQKNKPHKITRASELKPKEETKEEKRARLMAELEELGEE